MIQISVAVIIAGIVGVVQVAKSSGLPGKFAPLLALGLGITAALFLSSTTELAMRIFEGVILGLSASGLYSGAKATTEDIASKV